MQCVSNQENMIFVVDEGADKLGVIDRKTGKVVKKLKTGPDAYGGDPDGHYAYVAKIYGGSVSVIVIDIESMKVFAKAATGKAPNGVSLFPEVAMYFCALSIARRNIL